jgi:hypothetical protein
MVACSPGCSKSASAATAVKHAAQLQSLAVRQSHQPVVLQHQSLAAANDATSLSEHNF